MISIAFRAVCLPSTRVLLGVHLYGGTLLALCLGDTRMGTHFWPSMSEGTHCRGIHWVHVVLDQTTAHIGHLHRLCFEYLILDFSDCIIWNRTRMDTPWSPPTHQPEQPEGRVGIAMLQMPLITFIYEQASGYLLLQLTSYNIPLNLCLYRVCPRRGMDYQKGSVRSIS